MHNKYGRIHVNKVFKTKEEVSKEYADQALKFLKMTIKAKVKPQKVITYAELKNMDDVKQQEYIEQMVVQDKLLTNYI